MNGSRSYRNQNGVGDSRRRRGMVMVVSLVVSCLLLAACGNNGNKGAVKEDRQFANNAAPSEHIEPTATAPSAADSQPTATMIPAASPETLLRAQGAPDWTFAILKGTLFAIEPAAAERTPTIIPLPTGQKLLDFRASPDGERVAVLTAASADSAGDVPVSIALFGRDGKQIGDSRAIFKLAPENATPRMATPAGGATSPQGARVSWSPKGDALLVSAGDGQFWTIPVDGAPQSLAIAGIQGRVQSAAWSADGSTVLLLIRNEAGLGSIALAKPQDGKAMIQTIWPRSDEAHRKSVDEVVWMPQGDGVLFTQSAVRGGVPVEAQLFEMQITGAAPQLVATAGQAGPAARIAAFAVSPDGKSVAYTIERPSGNDWSFHSLWIRVIDGNSAFEVPVSSVVAVTGLEWSSAGLVWRQVSPSDQGGTDEELMLCAHDASVSVLARTRPVAATPAQGSPVSSPVATPT